VSSNKFYIPGETKEIEMLKKKGINNGSIIVADYIVKMAKNDSVNKKIKNEFLNNLGQNDLKMNIFMVFQNLKAKIEDL
jgi:type III secretion system FlhB-like substrate exporter